MKVTILYVFLFMPRLSHHDKHKIPNYYNSSHSSGSSLSTDDLTTEGSGFSTTDTTDSDYTTYDETGSGETSITDLPSTVAKDKDTSTTTTVIPPTKSKYLVVIRHH